MNNNNNNNDNPVGYWIGRILAYLITAVTTLLLTGGSLAILKLLFEFLLS